MKNKQRVSFWRKLTVLVYNMTTSVYTPHILIIIEVVVMKHELFW